MSTSHIETYNKLRALVESMDEDIKRYEEGKVKVCAKRYRSSLLECKKLCGDIRRFIQEDVKSLPKRKRSKPIDIPTSE